MANQTTFLDLPVDILLLIFPYLDATSFLHLTSTCKSLHKPAFTQDATYWSNLVRSTFRVPNQPVVENDGRRWQQLFRRLLTQSRVYTWGNNEKACLGHSHDPTEVLPAPTHPVFRRMNAARRRHVSWPAEMQGTEGLGVISDVQCGGWSTTVLTSHGALYAVGVMDGLEFHPHRRPVFQIPVTQPTPLRYPSGFAQAHERRDRSTAIRQFSTGRSHVLGLSDSGRIWSWQNIRHPALNVRFVHHDTQEDGTASSQGHVIKVVAGWNKSAALIDGIGIVLWDPLKRDNGESEIEDAALVLQSAVVPDTGYREHQRKRSAAVTQETSSVAERVGEVLNFIVLEHVVLVNTRLGKVFVSRIIWSNDEQRLDPLVELELDQTSATDTFATDVQGSFRSFAIFLRSGAVLTSHQDRVMNVLTGQAPTSDRLWTRIPALQHKDVISIAFGDYHFHALHSSGYITSYGSEPQACGALGLGGHGDPEGRLRGIRYQGLGGDGRLVPHAYTEGRRVWFEEEKQDWVTFMTAGGVSPSEAAERMRMALGSPDVRCQGEVSEWIEQQGRDWEEKFGLRDQHDDEDDGLPAYFALSVSAAGWHSAALVLVNEALASKVRAACEVRDTPEQDEVEQAEAVPALGTTASPSLLTSTVNTLLDYGRWFLGLPPYDASTGTFTSRNSTNAPRTAPGGGQAHHHFTEQIHFPRSYGDSPRPGYKYVWAYDHFPRLRLSNGVEMPGSVDFDDWRYPRPEFDLDAGV